MPKNGDNFLDSLDEARLARGLGYFSIGLGLAELLAPKAVGRMIGLEDRPGLLRLYGLREITAGLGILTQSQPTGWVWSRVAGDALDLATLGAAFASKQDKRGRVAAATAAVAGVAALDVICSRKLQKNPNPNRIQVHRSVVVNRPPDQLYSFWRDFENLPDFMNHVISVNVLDERRSHWKVKGPARTTVEWDAEIYEDRPNDFIAWRSIEGSEVDNSGSVKFERAVGGRGTIIKVEIKYNPPAGALGATVAKLFGEDPQKQVAVDLLRFKQLMETGEIARTEGQAAGRPRSTSKKFDDFVRT